MLLSEIRYYKERGDNKESIEMEMKLRAEACATVTAKVMSRVFSEEDHEEIVRLTEEGQRNGMEEIIANVDDLANQMKQPN
tara:strand:+ start:528 stop:770 length:243 start_codon:yes stop_codon:yes gene_type:complete